jgi:hypothetical protein
LLLAFARLEQTPPHTSKTPPHTSRAGEADDTDRRLQECESALGLRPRTVLDVRTEPHSPAQVDPTVRTDGSRSELGPRTGRARTAAAEEADGSD